MTDKNLKITNDGLNAVSRVGKCRKRIKQQTRDPAKRGTRAKGKSYHKPMHNLEHV